MRSILIQRGGIFISIIVAVHSKELMLNLISQTLTNPTTKPTNITLVSTPPNQIKTKTYRRQQYNLQIISQKTRPSGQQVAK